MLQLTHGTPPLPQAVSEVPVLQVFPSQQPLGQLVGVHTQLWSWPHSVPGGQVTQVTPRVPQSWL